MIYVSSELLFIKLFTTSKIFLIFIRLNINLKLSKTGRIQTSYVSRSRCLECLPPLGKSSASLGNKGGWEALGAQWHDMVSCKSHKCSTVSGS